MSADNAALWTRIQYLLQRVDESLEQPHLLRDFVDVLVELCGADAGALVSNEAGGAIRVLAARTRRRDMPSSMSSSVTDTLRATTYPDKRVKVVDLGPANQLVIAPIRQRVTARALGLLTLVYPKDAANLFPMIELVEAAATLARLLLRSREQVESANERVRASRVIRTGDLTPPSLDELLASESLRVLRADIDAALLGDAPLLILGESGTGKTQLATAIANASGRQPVVRATLGASDDLNTITSELFGHERGAFSGAVGKRKGLVEYADGGTLILDEILNLPPHAQQLLLDFTQFGTYRPLGYHGSEPKRSRVRLIAATNGNILQAIRDTRFRQDLFFRLTSLRLELPPLRKRRADIPSIAQSFLHRLDPVRKWTLTSESSQLLSSSKLEWAGNVRQLEGVLRRARDQALVAGEDGGELAASFFGDLESQVSLSPQADTAISPPVINESPDVSTVHPVGEAMIAVDEQRDVVEAWRDLCDRRESLDALEGALILRALEEAHGNIARASRLLGVSRTSLLSRRDTLGVEVDIETLRRR